MAFKAAVAAVLFVALANAAAQQQTGKIIFYRESHFTTNDYKPRILCDGAEIARMDGKSYFEAIAPTGRHVCVAESADGPPITIDVIPGNVVYVRVAITPGVMRHAFLALTTEEAFKQQSKLKTMASVLLKAEPPFEVSAPTAPSVPTRAPALQHTASLGDLAVWATNVYTDAIQDAPDKDQITIFISFHNAGDRAVCLSFIAKLRTTYGFEYLGYAGGSAARDLPPGMEIERTYSFDAKKGVKPLELKLQESRIGCESGSESASMNPSIPKEILLDVHDLPGYSPAPPPSDTKVARPGADGVSYPMCVYCPDPHYTAKARASHLEGTVRLQVVVGTDGLAHDIQLVAGIGQGLDEQAINAVQMWRFRPARGSDGQPIATIVPIEVTFRLLR